MIHETSMSFKNEPETNDKKNREDNKMKNEFNINIDINNQKKMPNLAHFGGKPFAGVKNNDPFENLKDMRNDYMNINNDKFNNQINNNNRNILNKNNDDFVIHKKKESSSVEKKDQNIWDAPEIKNNYKPKPNMVINSNNKLVSGRKISNPIQKLQNNSDIESGNNNRKIQKNEKKVDNKKENLSNNNKKKDAIVPKEGEKKTFLIERYPPNGVGPDSELIEMLEREVVDTNPCVKFEDIAELEGAKNILREAVLLPILMPQYFKVLIQFTKGNQKSMERSIAIWTSWYWKDYACKSISNSG